MQTETQWEYIHVTAWYDSSKDGFFSEFEFGKIYELKEIMNILGKAGWECFSHVPVLNTIFSDIPDNIDATEYHTSSTRINNCISLFFKRVFKEELHKKQSINVIT